MDRVDRHLLRLRPGESTQSLDREPGGGARVGRLVGSSIGDQDDVAAAELAPLDLVESGLEPGESVLVEPVGRDRRLADVGDAPEQRIGRFAEIGERDEA